MAAEMAEVAVTRASSAAHGDTTAASTRSLSNLIRILDRKACTRLDQRENATKAVPYGNQNQNENEIRFGNFS